MIKSTWVLGYHGCNRRLAEAVLRGEAVLQASANDYDWLGNGIYFWENSANRARTWAESGRTNSQGATKLDREPAVLGAVIDLGHCLDLLEAESIRLVKTAYERLEQNFHSVGHALPANSGSAPDRNIRRLDCAVINYLHDLREEESEPRFDSVRAAFTEGAPLYVGAGFHAQTHLQICIRNEAQIIGYFRVRTAER